MNNKVMIKIIENFDIRINDTDDIVCSLPNRCIFDVERKAKGRLRGFSLQKKKNRINSFFFV